jgi:hypothetical protein
MGEQVKGKVIIGVVTAVIMSYFTPPQIELFQTSETVA